MSPPPKRYESPNPCPMRRIRNSTPGKRARSSKVVVMMLWAGPKILYAKLVCIGIYKYIYICIVFMMYVICCMLHDLLYVACCKIKKKHVICCMWL